MFIRGNLISWKSKKQDGVTRSSVEVEYQAMILATCELLWLKHLFQEQRFGKDEQMKLISDNQVTLFLTLCISKWIAILLEKRVRNKVLSPDLV